MLTKSRIDSFNRSGIASRAIYHFVHKLVNWAWHKVRIVVKLLSHKNIKKMCFCCCRADSFFLFISRALKWKKSYKLCSHACSSLPLGLMIFLFHSWPWKFVHSVEAFFWTTNYCDTGIKLLSNVAYWGMEIGVNNTENYADSVRWKLPR